MIPSLFPVIVTIIGTLVLVAVYWYVYNQYREKFMGIWAVAWSVYALRFIFDSFLKVTDNSLFTIGSHLTNIISSLLIFWGVQNYISKKIPRIVYAIFSLTAAWILIGTALPVSPMIYTFPTFVFGALVFIWAGLMILRYDEIKGIGKYIGGWGYILWGIHKMDYPFITSMPWLEPWAYALVVVLELSVAMGTLLVYFEKMRAILSAKETSFRLLAENAQDFIYRYKIYPVRGFEFVSQSIAKMTGYQITEFYNNPELINQIIYPEDAELVEAFLQKDYSQQPVVVRLITKDGHIIWTEHRLVVVVNEEENTKVIEGIARDVTERRQSEQVLKRFRLLSEQARDVMIFFRKDGSIFDFNNAVVKAYGYTREEYMNMTIYDLHPSDRHEALAEHIEKARSGGLLFETVHKSKNGLIFPVEVSLQGFYLEKEPVMFCIVRNISERKKAEETISHLAYHDLLTDLPNRLLFYDRLSTALLNAKRNNKMLAIMFLDLDRFKYVNDIMGHAIGDQLLKEVAEKLSNCIRANDTVARIGGDEFTILLPEISREEDAAVVAEKIIAVLKKPWIFENREFQITSSVGIALFPNDGTDADTLTKNADTAMYRAKEQGDNYQFYNPSMNVKAIARMEIERNLRKALDQEEFEVYFQPQVDVKEKRIVGFEALLRWQHPHKGAILPPDFISVAEDTGLIIPIGEWVLRTACRQNMAWQRLGFPQMRISVNISACQFRQKGFLDTVAGILEETNMPSELLELEITEITAMHDAETTVEIMDKLRKMGVRIAIDDFGTGYSSLSYLRRFPITTIKVDRSFVYDVLSNVDNAAIVATIIVLAHNLRLNVIVEGIEKWDQLKFFEQQECYEMQGYLFSQPQPAHIAEKFICDSCWEAVG